MSRAVIILGMHRSGTSCLTGSLQEAGLHLGEVNQKARCNEKGTRENISIMELNDAVLASVGAAWNKPPCENVTWREDHKTWRNQLIKATAQGPVWGFKDPRTLLTLDGWLDALPNAKLTATFRNPYAVAQSLNARNGFPIEHGLALWSAYNERLLEACRAWDVSVINFDWSPILYRRGLELLCADIGLDTPTNGFSFFESKLRKSDGRIEIDMPAPLRTIYRRLQYEARRTLRARCNENPPAIASPVSIEKEYRVAADNITGATFHAHSVRLFPKGGGAGKYESTGIASRCDWLIVSDRAPPNVELRLQRETNAPRHIFLSMRSPYAAIQYFADDVLPTLTSPFVLVSGSEDVTIPQQCDKRFRPYNDKERDAIARILENKMLLRWFAENLVDGSDNRFAPLPTGLVFGEPCASHKIVTPKTSTLIDRPLRMLCAHRMRDGNQWSLRRSVSAMAKKEWALWSTVIEEELPIDDYLRLVSRHAFVLCVEGGGVDPSPKAWQAILCGSIPIIRRSALSSAYEALPVAIVDDWKADEITPATLAAWRKAFAPSHDVAAKRRETIRRLGLDFWWDKVENAARRS